MDLVYPCEDITSLILTIEIDKNSYFRESIATHLMKVKTSEVIAGLTTTIIFVALFSVILGVPNGLPDLSDLKDWFKTEEKVEAKPKSKSSTSSGSTGKVIDNFNGVKIYYNGKVRNVFGRNVTPDGYNLGLKYQCVEFVKRYYYEHYNHKMPNSYGNAKDFYDYALPDGTFNRDRGLVQYANPSTSKPAVGDLIIFGPTQWNQFGHVAIVSKVKRTKIEIAQQNPGTGNPSRQSFSLTQNGSLYQIDHQYVLGWLRKG